MALTRSSIARGLNPPRVAERDGLSRALIAAYQAVVAFLTAEDDRMAPPEHGEASREWMLDRRA
jgi:hypothetical protein